MKKFPEHSELNLPSVADELLERWEAERTFEESLELRKDAEPFVFYEGPPSANGLPGIHHVMARTIKDVFCRFRTQQGHLVNRKAGWDTHGLPVELSVEKELGITKEDIGTKVSVEDYNQACRKAVMKYTDVWNEVTRKAGYWLDLSDPYITYKTKYIESVWYQLKQLYDQGLIYKGYTIQPYSPAAGTGLSTHELNQPGTYRSVKDTSAVAMFKVQDNAESNEIFKDQNLNSLFLIAWTTTPWTLPSNTALTVGPKLDYVSVKTFNPYTHDPCTVILAEARVSEYFSAKSEVGETVSFDDYKKDGKNIPWELTGRWKGADLAGIRYEQLLPYAQPEAGDAFKVITGNFVTTEDGTGIVHTAPSFGADDQYVAKQHGIGSLTMVDLQGRFTKEMGEFAGRYVKNEYYVGTDAPERSVDIDLSIRLKEMGRAFKVEKYEHNYPHCWRTDKPILYYPLDSWFVKVTERKDQLVALNKEINWKPASTGTGRFGNWLENLQDWNLSRSRFWGIPLPIWTTDDGEEVICIGSVEELKSEIARAIDAGIMLEDPLATFDSGDMTDSNYDGIDLHRPYVDKIVLVSSDGRPMTRESDLIDVWFDSGSMPYAQWHYPFENEAVFEKNFPADFIAEGVDQTRGWFYTLHAIATLNHNSVAYKSVVSNGLVLDKNGQKMSKRLGNAVDPFETLSKYGADAVRWYMLSNAQPWDNLKFDEEGIVEVQRKFFRALHSTYSFFALYANIDGFDGTAPEVPVDKRPEMDRWIISKLNTLTENVETAYSSYEPTDAAREIQAFVVDHLSNWYVRLNRRRFWKGEAGEDKNAAYQTLYQCLETLSMLSAPIAPFFSDRLFRDLEQVTELRNRKSVHLTDWPSVNKAHVNEELELRMDIAQRCTSLVLSLRKKENIRVRQPLARILVPVMNPLMKRQLEEMKELILGEVNVHDLELIPSEESDLVKTIKPDFKKLGPRFGKKMKAVSALVMSLDQGKIAELEQDGSLELELDGGRITLTSDDVQITTADLPGWSVANDRDLTVALDITLTEPLKMEGIARELVSKIQQLRKNEGFEVTDRIQLIISRNGDDLFERSIAEHAQHILDETLATNNASDLLVDDLNGSDRHSVDLLDGVRCTLAITKNQQ
jgi:isoleucyl-tRNA synthetase